MMDGWDWVGLDRFGYMCDVMYTSFNSFHSMDEFKMDIHFVDIN